MLRTVEEAMSQAINWWGDLPPPMKEAIGQFRTQLGGGIDCVEFVKRALDREVHETDRVHGLIGDRDLRTGKSSPHVTYFSRLILCPR
jgi:hypothetical protein